jgi:hypothetical protein
MIPPVFQPSAVRRIVASILFPVACLLAAYPVGAAEKPSVGAMWRTAAEADVEAAARLIADDHPAMLPEAGDTGFRVAFETAHKLAVERARAVDSAAGYMATLGGFAVALADKHIQSRPTMLTARPKWAGIIVAKWGNRWVVADEDVGAAGPLKGSELVSCDGVPVEEFARTSLGAFRVDWNVGAQQVQIAPWLLVDEGNPFVKYPQSCSFARDGTAKPVALEWRAIPRDKLVPRLDRALAGGLAGFGVRSLGRGQVIAIQSLNPYAPNAEQVVQEVQAKAAALRASPYILIDLRGNTGGNSLYGRRIADILLGKDHVESVLGAADSDCYEIWRVSAANIATLRNYQRIAAQQGDKELIAIVEKMLADALAAEAKGKPLSGSPKCDLAKRGKKPAPSTYRGRLFILTDNRCFSSCLMMVDNYRMLGATQIGETTDANTHYTQVRHAPMPSGLSSFSTLQAISPDSPRQVGPFVPHIAFDGDLADNEAVEAWLIKVTEGGEPEAH